MKLSQLHGVAIVDEDGRTLGHFADLRCQWTRANARTASRATVQRIAWGTAGVLERLGLRAVASDVVNWRDVVSIDRDRIVVRARAAKRNR